MKEISTLETGYSIFYGYDKSHRYRPLVVEIDGHQKTVHAGSYGILYIWHNRTTYQLK